MDYWSALLLISTEEWSALTQIIGESGNSPLGQQIASTKIVESMRQMMFVLSALTKIAARYYLYWDRHHLATKYRQKCSKWRWKITRLFYKGNINTSVREFAEAKHCFTWARDLSPALCLTNVQTAFNSAQFLWIHMQMCSPKIQIISKIMCVFALFSPSAEEILHF